MKILVAPAAVCVLLVGLGGCSHGLTPELKGLAHTDVENRNMVRVTNNQNSRMIADDLARTFYVDHPSRLSPYPVMSTSGMPR